jgi:hypothetical protein
MKMLFALLPLALFSAVGSLAFSETTFAAIDPSIVGTWRTTSLGCSDRSQESDTIRGARVSAEMTVAANGAATYVFQGEKPGANPVNLSYSFVIAQDNGELTFSQIWMNLKVRVPVPFVKIHGTYEKHGANDVVAHLHGGSTCGSGTLDHHFVRVSQ